MKKILYFYPHKFGELTDGIHTRIVTILEYFKSREFEVDFVCLENATVKDPYVVKHNLVTNFYTVSEPAPRHQYKAKKYVNRVVKLVSKRWRRHQGKPELPDWVTPPLSDKIAELVTANNYHALLVTYQYWASIALEFNKSNFATRKIIDPTDFLTLQQFYVNKELTYPDLGRFFGTELERLSYFDDVIYISNDELFTFSGFLPKAKHHFIPQYFKRNVLYYPKANLHYDLLFVGSKNPYNVEGVIWFLEDVLPLLNANIRIGIAGNVCTSITKGYPNVSKLGFVENIDTLYQVSRCTICPLKRGSGMKIKVVESLSYGVPVIATSKGMDGFTNKNTGYGIMVENEPEGFAETIHQLVSNEVFYQQQCIAATQTFENTFSYEANFKKLDGIFNAATSTADRIQV